jgi:stage II sporulation protein AB (anti-sigma F factor)
VSDIKTAVSEAVTNSIVHGYKGQEVGVIQIECSLEGDEKGGILHIRIADNGCGIADVEEALQPFFSTAEKDERSGMGFTIMQTFMDGFFIESKVGEGTAITMSKKIGASVVEC